MRKQFSEPTEYTNNPDASTYQTGHTAPPKYYRGIIAILMIAVIFLLGLASALGMINIRLLMESARRNADQAPVSVYLEGSSATDSTGLAVCNPPELPRKPSVDVPLVEPAQQAAPSQQQILQRNEDTAVSVQCLMPSGQMTQLPGIIADAGGYILTTAAVSRAQYIFVSLSDGSTYPAAFVGADGFSDLAVIYIQAKNLTAAEFVDSDLLSAGDFLGTVREGNILSKGALQCEQQKFPLGSDMLTVMQTGLGSFLGPLYNANGQLAGMGVPFLEGCCDQTGGLALSSTSIKSIMEQLIRQGYVSGRPTLGARLEELELSHQRYFGLPSGLRVTEGDEQNILQPGDILTAVDQSPISDWHTYYQVLWDLRPGDRVHLTVFREGQKITLEATVGKTGD